MTHLYALLFIEIKNSGYGSPYQASGQASPALPEPQLHPSGRKSVLAKFSSRLNVPGFMHQKCSFHNLFREIIYFLRISFDSTQSLRSRLKKLKNS